MLRNEMTGRLAPFLSVLALLLALLPAPGRAADGIRAFGFGAGLARHAGTSSVPYWLAHLARADGQSFAMDGTGGSLRAAAADLPPAPDWGLPQVPRAWNTREHAFRRAGFDTVLIAPDRVAGEDALAAVLRLLDWTAFQAPGLRYFIYQDPAQDGAAGRGAFQAHVAALRAARPDLSITLIPVADVLEKLSDMPRFSGLVPGGPAEAGEAGEAQGTPSLHFLSALVTYSVLYAQAPPAGVDLPTALDPRLRRAYRALAASIWAEVSGAVPPPAGLRLAPETGLANPSIAMGLNGVSDWSSQMPFLDVMKTARTWTGHKPDEWGAVDYDQLVARGVLDAQGWPRRIPEGVEALEAFILTDLPPGAVSTAGRYRVTWAGQGRLRVIGRARNVTRRPGNEIRFDFAPGPGLVAIRIEATEPDDPIRDIVVVKQENIPLLELGEIFNPDWIARIRDFRALRFMDWMKTNGSDQVAWDDRPRPDDFSYDRRGVPVEVMVRLANEVAADPWFTLPHQADDAYVTAFARYVRDHLDPSLRVYAEWSNEVWNWQFPQAHWAQAQAEARWGPEAGEAPWVQYAGLRAAQVADIWARVFGAAAPDRLVRVIATQTGWGGLEKPLLNAPLAQREGHAPPADSFDAYAVTGYFGYDRFGFDGDGADTQASLAALRRWIAEGVATDRAYRHIRDGALHEMIRDVFPYHLQVARTHGLSLVMYEGGSHVVGLGDQVDDPVLTAFFTAFNYSPGMARLYAELIAGWRAAGGTLFNAFVDVAAPSKWGSWGALRHLDDINPRWATLMAWNAAPAGLPRRPPGTFTQGVARRGTAGRDAMAGTAEADIMLGLGGDDSFMAGPGDRLHGGAGADRATLPGRRADYTQGRAGRAVTLAGPEGAVRLVAVETVFFADEPEAPLQLGTGDRGR